MPFSIDQAFPIVKLESLASPKQVRGILQFYGKNLRYCYLRSDESGESALWDCLLALIEPCFVQQPFQGSRRPACARNTLAPTRKCRLDHQPCSATHDPAPSPQDRRNTARVGRRISELSKAALPLRPPGGSPYSLDRSSSTRTPSFPLWWRVCVLRPQLRFSRIICEAPHHVRGTRIYSLQHFGSRRAHQSGSMFIHPEILTTLGPF